MLNDVSCRPVTRGVSLACSASPVGEGALLRLAGQDSEELAQEFERHLHPLSRVLGDNPWRRKW